MTERGDGAKSDTGVAVARSVVRAGEAVRAPEGAAGAAHVVVGGGVDARSVGDGAGRVTVPRMLKSRNSRGPTVPAGGGAAVLVAGAAVS